METLYTPSKKTKIGKFIICVLILVIVFLVGGIYSSSKNKSVSFNMEAYEFMKFFVDVVLIQEAEVTTEQRLELESKVRLINDKNILNRWNKFVESEDPVIAEENAVELIHFLVDSLVEKK